MKLAIIGATGLVGRKMIEIVFERGIELSELYLGASDRSANKVISINGKAYRIDHVPDILSLKPDVALFSAGSNVSYEYAPQFADNGCFVIDNSSVWRLHDHIPLVVPEINSQYLSRDNKIIANPNCSTIQLVMVLYPLHQLYGLKRVTISTYQSVSGSGKKGIDQLISERKGLKAEPVYAYPIDFNCFPHGGKFLDNGYSTEEMKLLDESRKILDLPDLEVAATVVRIPVIGGHSESVSIEFDNEVNLEEVIYTLSNFPGIKLENDSQQNIYPMPLTVFNRDEVFVGRIRKDLSRSNILHLWIVADNVRKGAATNAVQILQKLIEQNIVNV